MLTSLFDYELPPERIAQHPVSPRDASRLLVVGESLEDKHFRDLPTLLLPGDLLVFNDSKVIPARLSGKRDEAQVSITLFKRLDDRSWRVLAKPAKRLKPGDTVRFGVGFNARVEEKNEDGFITLRFNSGGATQLNALHHFGKPPLPPYIKRENGPDSENDKATYQTIYAKEEGSIAAPTAGLHFTQEIMDALSARGVQTAYVTLHVGGGTFLPVKTEDTEQHIMHSEYAVVPEETVQAVNVAKQESRRVIAVGTTALRTLESAATADNTLQVFAGDTDIFITPGYRFKIADLLLTNFHLPCSTLLMLISAFSGMQRIREAYTHAIQQEYRFYSYGDACLLHRFDKDAIS